MNSWFRDIWEVLWEVLGYFQIVTFIDAFDEGVLLRRGRFKRCVGGDVKHFLGVAWHLPLEIDEITVMNVKPTAMELAAQSVTTADGQDIVLRAVILWGIFDIRKAMIDVEDCTGSLGNIAVGLIQECVEVTDLADIRTRAFRTLVKKHIQKQARKWGISVSTVRFQDLTVAPSYRIFGGLANGE